MVLSKEIDSIDPGITVYAPVANLLGVVHRSLFMVKPGHGLQPQPDLATGRARITDDGRTITVRIRRGVHFAPPVNREVVAADFEYGIERMLLPTVTNPVAPQFLADVVGLEAVRSGRTADLAGVEAPDDTTLVIRLRNPSAGTLLPLLQAPFVVPVPREYAQRFDARRPSAYGRHQVATGPYRFEADERGKITDRGFSPTRGARLTRNPNWRADTDDRPAHLDSIEFRLGNDDDALAGRRVVSGRGMAMSGHAPAQVVRGLSQRDREQLLFQPASDSITYLTLNTSKPPFNDVEVRRAVFAALDRTQLRRTNGGPLFGRLATHFIPPDLTGFRESGGDRGFRLPFPADPAGDPAAAAGVLSRIGRGQKRPKVNLFVFAAKRGVGEALHEQLERAAFEVRLRVVSGEVLVQNCGRASRAPEMCLIGWVVGASDPSSFFSGVFSSAAINPKFTTNFSLLRSPEIDRAISAAKATSALGARARAWATVNRLVLESAAAVPLVWDHAPILHSRDVHAVGTSAIDYAYSGLRR